MFGLLLSLLATLRSALRTRAELALENLALRQPPATLRRAALCRIALKWRAANLSPTP
jgi:hypothetical protein